MRRILFLQCIVLASIWASPTAALSRRMMDWCAGKNHPTPQQMVRGCTAAINSGKFKGGSLGGLYINRGIAYKLTGKHDRAMRDYEVARRLVPESPLLYISRGDLLIDMGRYEDALIALDMAISLNTKATLAYYNRGNVYIKIGKYGKAIDDYTTAIRLDPRYSPAYANRAYAHYALKNYDAVIADTTQAIKFLPKSASKHNRALPLRTRFMGYFGKKDYEKALMDANRIVALDSESGMIGNRAVVYEKMGMPALALADANRLISLDNKNANGWGLRCWFRAELGRLEQALADCNHALELRPNYADTLDVRGLVYLKLKQYDKAIAEYNAALKITGYVEGGPATENMAIQLYGRGLARLRKGDALGGATDMAAAKAADPDIVAEFQRYGI